MDLEQARTRLDFREEAGGALTAILTVSLPGGIVRRFESTLDDAGLELELEPELAPAPVVGALPYGYGRPGDRDVHPWRYDCVPGVPPARRVAGLVEIGRTSTDHLGPEQDAHRKRLSWRALVAAPEYGKRPKDAFALMRWVGELGGRKPPGWKLEASTQTINEWWSALGHDWRKKWKIRYAALIDHAPPGLSDDDLNTWWRNVGKSKRSKWRDDAYTDFWESAGNVVKEIASSKVFQVAAIGLVSAVPGLGAVAGPALAAASTLNAGAKLLKSSVRAARGETDKARELTSSAVSASRKQTRTPDEAKRLIDAANEKRKNVQKLVTLGRPNRAPRPPLGSISSTPKSEPKRLPGPPVTDRGSLFSGLSRKPPGSLFAQRAA